MPAAEPAASPIEFYFDFVSPFGYFASLRIDALAARHGRTVDWRAMLIGVSVTKVMGIQSLLGLPLKGDYIRRDGARYARRHGIALGRDVGAVPVNPLAAGRAFCWAKRHDPGRARPLARAIFDAYWARGEDIAAPEAVLAIAANAGVDRAALAAALASGEASALLRAAVDDSLARGVFGSPFFIVDGEPFFGAEKLELLEEWLATGGW